MKLLLDTDFLFGIFVPTDPHHERSDIILKNLREKDTELYISNFVLAEIATVLSYKVSQKEALRFLKAFSREDIHHIFVLADIEVKAWELFKKQTKKGTSFVDCANLACIDYYHLDGILSFDSFYPKSLRIGE